MKITFSLQNTEAFALSESRFFQIYDLLRSYNGKKQGEFWSSYDAMDYLHGVTFRQDYEDEHGEPVWWIRGESYNKNLFQHAFHVHHSMINFKYQLGVIHRKGGSLELKKLKLLKTHLLFLLGKIEW